MRKIEGEHDGAREGRQWRCRDVGKKGGERRSMAGERYLRC